MRRGGRLKGLELPSWWLEVSRASAVETWEPHFGGIPYLEEETRWPQCTFCASNEPMPFVGQFALPKEFRPHGAALFAFYKCDVFLRQYGSQEHHRVVFFSEPSPLRVHVALPGPVMTQLCTVKLGAPRPQAPDALSLPASARKRTRRRPPSKSCLGGWPQWTNVVDWTPSCSKCQKTMRQLAQFYPDDVSGFNPHEQLSLFYCEAHADETRMVQDFT